MNDEFQSFIYQSAKEDVSVRAFIQDEREWARENNTQKVRVNGTQFRIWGTEYEEFNNYIGL